MSALGAGRVRVLPVSAHRTHRGVHNAPARVVRSADGSCGLGCTVPAPLLPGTQPLEHHCSVYAVLFLQVTANPVFHV